MSKFNIGDRIRVGDLAGICAAFRTPDDVLEITGLREAGGYRFRNVKTGTTCFGHKSAIDKLTRLGTDMSKVNPSLFKVGDRVKFTDYDHHDSEYGAHRDQSAVISKLPQNYNGDFSIIWDDGSTSGVWASENFWGMYKVNNNGDNIMEQYQRKTYRLKVDTPSMKKGALLQERCDDGTQPYDMLNAETHSKDTSYNISFAKRELVEGQPKFFEEVFVVTPAYVNAKELELWENFKKAQSKKAKK